MATRRQKSRPWGVQSTPSTFSSLIGLVRSHFLDEKGNLNTKLHPGYVNGKKMLEDIVRSSIPYDGAVYTTPVFTPPGTIFCTMNGIGQFDKLVTYLESQQMSYHTIAFYTTMFASSIDITPGGSGVVAFEGRSAKTTSHYLGYRSYGVISGGRVHFRDVTLPSLHEGDFYIRTNDNTSGKTWYIPYSTVRAACSSEAGLILAQVAYYVMPVPFSGGKEYAKFIPKGFTFFKRRPNQEEQTLLRDYGAVQYARFMEILDVRSLPFTFNPFYDKNLET